LVKIDTFLGADLTSSPENVSVNRSPNCENMLRDVPGKVRKRTGWAVKYRLDGRINGCHGRGSGAMLLHAGTALYVLHDDGTAPEPVYTAMADRRSCAWEFGKKLYIADGRRLLCWDGETAVPVENTAYVPTKTIARAPNGGGQSYEALNLLQPKFTEQFLGEANTKVYQLSYAPLDSAEVQAWILQTDGTWQQKSENVHFSVNRAAGTVQFVSAPGESPVTGQDNVKITAVRTVEGYAQRVNGCTIGIAYGVGGSPDRLFLSGNSAYPNYDWYSGLNDPTYWSDQSYAVLGQSDSAIVGYSIVNAYLATHKNGGEAQRNVFLREGNLVDGQPSFPLVNILQGEGAVAPYTFGYLGAEPLFVTRLGIYAITAQDITGEKYSQNRSFYLNGALCAEENLADAFAVVYKDMYWLCLNGKIYILDGLQATRADSDSPYATRQYAGFYCTGVPARVMWTQDDVLWFGTEDGRVCAFAAETDKTESYNDDGAPIYACWSTPGLSGRVPYRQKMFRRIYAGLASASATGVRMLARVNGQWEELLGGTQNARYFSYANMAYSKLTYSCNTTPHTLGGKINVRHVDKAYFRVENGELNEPLGLDSLSLEFAETGYLR
jgi:hypothetical protein